jgi:hypothetical protein
MAFAETGVGEASRRIADRIATPDRRAIFTSWLGEPAKNSYWVIKKCLKL